MKVIIILFVIVVAIVVTVVYFGGLAGWDPAAELDKFKTSVQPGMNWEQVVAVRKPKKYQAFSAEGFGGLAPAQDFNPENIRKAVEGGKFEDGFLFSYTFAADAVYEVHFDADGIVTGVHKARTAADLLGP
jgi:hypothetical protein